MKNIILTGFMASGKTVVGQKVSELLGYDFVDTDAMIEKKENRTVNEIFASFGEEYFRNAETEAAQGCSNFDNSVISCGGGLVLRRVNLEYLKKNGIVFNLNPTEEVIASRLKEASKTRPLLRNDSIDGILNRFKERKPYYDNCDFRINVTSDKSVEAIASEIIEIYKKEADL